MQSGAERREVVAWSMYAWANHGWVTTVGTVLIGPWLLALATFHAGDHTTLFRVGPLPLHADAYASAVITAAAVLQLLVLPLVGSAADAARSQRRWIRFACVTGSVFAALLATTAGGAWIYAGLLFLAGSVCLGVSDIVYNSFLPKIAPPGRRDAVSSVGFAYGYAGGGVLLAINLALIEFHGAFGLSKASAVRVCFLSAGAWWAGFGIWALNRLQDRPSGARLSGRVRQRFTEGMRLLSSMPQTRRYLIAFLLFSDAISAVIALSSTFITHELFDDSASRASSFLFELILVIQFVAVGGSLLFARIASRLGAKRTILIGLAGWCLIILYSYAELHTKADAVAVGLAIAIVLGGTQALARSLFSQLVPAGLEATFFGLYEVANEGTSWIAPLLFTIVVDATGSFRQAILSLLVLFVSGAGLLALTNVEAARREHAGAISPVLGEMQR
jgi:MFS transporter, UMF1 family